jgi:hypothetical protein
MSLKPYYELECSNLKEIQEQTLTYLNAQFDLSAHSTLKTDLWVKLNTKEFIKFSPALVSWTRELGLTIKETAITVVNDTAGADLHIDELPVVAKINIPILNTQNVLNQWYEVPKSILETIPPNINKFGAKFYNLSSVDLSLCDKIGEIELVKPVVFNSQIPHCVTPINNAQFPRVVLCCMFFKEPVNLLQ